jgi:hypothetical protein
MNIFTNTSSNILKNLSVKILNLEKKLQDGTSYLKNSSMIPLIINEDSFSIASFNA